VRRLKQKTVFSVFICTVLSVVRADGKTHLRSDTVLHDELFDTYSIRHTLQAALNTAASLASNVASVLGAAL